MKIAVIGYGNVGMAVFGTLIRMRNIDELALVGRNIEKIQGELEDFEDALVLYPDCRKKLTGGGYEHLKDADIIIYTVGPAVKKATMERIELVSGSLEVVKQVSEELNKYNRDAIIIAISNPVDIVTHALMKYTGRPRNKVIGTGTLLDTIRLNRFVGNILEISPTNLGLIVLGEHGSSSCIIWSISKILGYLPEEYLNAVLPDDLEVRREKMLEANQRAGYRIYNRKGFTSHGVAASAARIVNAILNDSNEIFPVSTYAEGEYGISGISLSLPCLVNRDGAKIIDGAKFTQDELENLHRSAETIRAACKGILID